MTNYVIFTTFSGIKGTTEANYQASIQNARLINDFKGFENTEQVKEYIVKYFGYAPENVIVVS